MAALLEAALADLLAHPGGSQDLAGTLRRLAGRGHIEPFLKDGGYGFRATAKGLEQALLRMEAKGHG
jgi:hypothetical protein